MTPKETLLKAADLLETKGWTQREYALKKDGTIACTYDEASCFCSIGAICAADGRRPHHDAGLAVELFRDYIAEHYGQFVVQWNDAEDQTAENVIKALRECAESLDA